MSHPAPPPPAPPQRNHPEDDRPPGATPYRSVPGAHHAPGPSAPPPLPTPTYHRRHRGFRLAGLAVVGLVVVGGVLSNVPQMVRDAEDEVIALPEGMVELEVHGDAGDMLVREVGPDQPTGITASKHWSFREPTVRVDTAGGVTSVSLACTAASVGQCYADWTVAVPAGVKVVLHAGVGDVDVAGVTGEVTVDGSVGDVHVSGSPSALDVATSVGQVSAVLEGPAELVRLSSSVGDIDLRLPEGVAYDVRASSPVNAPTVEVETSDQSEYDVDVTTSVGSVVITDG